MNQTIISPLHLTALEKGLMEKLMAKKLQHLLLKILKMKIRTILY